MLQLMVYRHKTSHIYWLKRMHANRLLDSAKPGHIVTYQVIDQLLKRLMMVIKVKDAHVTFRLANNLCVDDRCCYFHYMFELKIG